MFKDPQDARLFVREHAAVQELLPVTDVLEDILVAYISHWALQIILGSVTAEELDKFVRESAEAFRKEYI